MVDTIDKVRERGASRFLKPSDFEKADSPGRERRRPGLATKPKKRGVGRPLKRRGTRKRLLKPPRLKPLSNPAVYRPLTSVRRAVPKFGKNLRRLHPAGRALDIIDVLDDLTVPARYPTGLVVPNSNNGWRLRSVGGRPMGRVIMARTGWPTRNQSKYNAWAAAGYPVDNVSLAGQAHSAITSIATRTEFGYWADPTPNDAIDRYYTVKTYWRANTNNFGPDFVNEHKTVVAPALWPMIDPNIMRQLPSDATVGVPVQPAPDFVIGVGEGLGHPLARPAAVRAQMALGVSVIPVPHENVVIVNPPTEGSRVPSPVINPPGQIKHKWERPPRHRRERKMRGSVYYFFMLMDALSEAAEVVDAAFEALPEDVQKRWKKGRKSRKFLDNAGQFGIDGADWKMQAVWHNAHKLDPVEFVKNLIANQVEDKLIGSLHKHLPRNFINANEDGQEAYGKLVKELLKALGLEEEEEENGRKGR